MTNPEISINESGDIGLQKQRAARLTVVSNALLTVLKVSIVVISGSASVLAELINSAGDLFGSAITFFTVRAADSPPDESHAYGHGKLENLSGIMIAMLVFVGAVFACADAVYHLFQHSHVTQSGPAIVVMAISAAVNLFVSQYLLANGKRFDSPALTADGHHLRTDILSSAAAFIGLVLTRITKIYWIDPAVAIGITLVIFRVAFYIARDAVLTLSDVALPAEEEDLLKRALEEDTRVLGYHKLRTRKSGSHRHIDVHVQIDDRNTFVQAHQFTEEMEDKLRSTLPNLHPIIHIEPYEAEKQHQQEQHGIV